MLMFIGSLTQAAVIHKIDDSTVTGDLQSIDAGKLLVSTKAKSVGVPLDEISQITLKDPPALPVAPPTPVATAAPVADDSANAGGGLLGALFGSAHPQHLSAPVAVVVKHAPASQTAAPAIAISGLFQLTDGDLIHARLNSWSDQKLQLQLAGGSSLELPSTAFSELWLGTADQQAAAKKLTVDPGPEDVAFVTKENDVIAIKGLARGITGNTLQFRFGDQDRKINLSKVVGLQLRGNSLAPMTAFHQVISTDSGDRFSGTLSAIEHDSVTLTTPAGSLLKLPMSSVTTIDFLNGRVTFLTDLKPAKVEETPYFGRVIPYKVNQSLAGGPLVLSDGPCLRGIAVHSRCVLQFDVSSGFDRFKTKLGFEQPDGRLGRVLARVLGDGKPLYENPDARGDQPPVEIDVPLAGVHVLTLEIDFGKDQDVGDRVVWADPRLLREKN
jgi:hypothetical protein